MTLQLAVAASVLPASRARVATPLQGAPARTGRSAPCASCSTACGLPDNAADAAWAMADALLAAGRRGDVAPDSLVRSGLPGAARLHSRPAAGPLGARRPGRPAQAGGRDRRIPRAPRLRPAGRPAARRRARRPRGRRRQRPGPRRGLRGARGRARRRRAHGRGPGLRPRSRLPGRTRGSRPRDQPIKVRSSASSGPAHRRCPNTFRCATGSSAACRWPWSSSRHPRRAAR